MRPVAEVLDQEDDVAVVGAGSDAERVPLQVGNLGRADKDVLSSDEFE